MDLSNIVICKQLGDLVGNWDQFVCDQEWLWGFRLPLREL